MSVSMELWIAAVAAGLVACSAAPDADATDWRSLGSGMESNVSGAALVPDAKEFTVLIVRDNKEPEENRVSLMSFPTGGGEPEVTPLTWDGDEPEDIEAVDAVPGHPGEFATLTSRGEGTLIRVDGATAKSIGSFRLPDARRGARYEALALATLSGRPVAVWSDRGQGAAPATISAATFDVAGRRFGAPVSMRFQAVGMPDDARDVSDLKMTPGGRLVATSAWEQGDDGPFTGAVYDAGTLAVTPDGLRLVPPATTRPYLTLDGKKVEALACAPGTCFFGADDENLGGAARIITEAGPSGPAVAALMQAGGTAGS